MMVEKNQPSGASTRRTSNRQTEELVRKFGHWMQRSGGALIDRYGEETAAVIRGEIRGKAFEFGIDMTECAIVKFLHAEGADELCPYLCDIDYVSAEAMGFGLRRTKTLSWSCDRCDFRLSRDAVTPALWPPELVERTCS